MLRETPEQNRLFKPPVPEPVMLKFGSVGKSDTVIHSMTSW